MRRFGIYIGDDGALMTVEITDPIPPQGNIRCTIIGTFSSAYLDVSRIVFAGPPPAPTEGGAV